MVITQLPNPAGTGIRRRRPSRPGGGVDIRASLINAAIAALEDGGPEAVQARALTAAVGVSTQAIYTHFGGMPSLFEALVAEGLLQVAAHVESVPETNDAVADHFCKGWALVDWAQAHPQLYRLMLGLTGGDLRLHPGLEITMSGTLANFTEGQAAAQVLMRSVERMRDSERIRPLDPVVVAAQFLVATHGFILLDIAGAFGDRDTALSVIAQLSINLMVGLGDSADAAEQSLLAAVARHEGHVSSEAP